MVEDAVPGETPAAYSPLDSAFVDAMAQTSIRLRSGTATVEITALAPDLVRVGMFPIIDRCGIQRRR